ncbi:MAG: hypothetical protein ACE141_06035 [Bryobacteraceae bacterium]
MPGCETAPTIAELEAGVESARAELRRAEAAAKAARERDDLLGRAIKTLNARLLESSRECEKALGEVFDQIVTAFASPKPQYPITAATYADGLLRQQIWMSKCYTAALYRGREAALLAQQAEALVDYQRAALMECEAAVAEAQWTAKLAGAGLGPAVVQVHDAPHVQQQRAAAEAKARAIRVRDDAEARLREFREKHSGDLRMSLG